MVPDFLQCEVLVHVEHLHVETRANDVLVGHFLYDVLKAGLRQTEFERSKPCHL